VGEFQLLGKFESLKTGNQKTNWGFNLQKVSIETTYENLKNIQAEVDEAMQSYSWIYQNVNEPHDVLVEIILPRKFTPKK
jgi:hypothetical protein